VTGCRNLGRSAALALHFLEGDAEALAAARAHLEGCAACRDYRAGLSSLQGALEAWADESPPKALRERVLARALSTARQAPGPATATHALPLFGLLPVMATLVAAIRLVAVRLPDLPYSRWFEGLAVLELLGPTGTAAFLMLALGALATLALAPALFLESRGSEGRPRRTVGLHG
jgi:hypothetical protein